jgi:hypothetical protein
MGRMYLCRYMVFCGYIVFVWVDCICVGILYLGRYIYFMGISYLCKYFVMCGYMVFV